MAAPVAKKHRLVLELDLNGKISSDDDLKSAICGHDKLTSLDLSWSDVTDKGLGLIAHLPLTELSLTHCLSLTEEGLEHLKKMPLKVLSLGDCKMTDVIVQAATCRFPRLEALFLPSGKNPLCKPKERTDAQIEKNYEKQQRRISKFAEAEARGARPLEEPIPEERIKDFAFEVTYGPNWAVAHAQGRRPAMEDTHLACAFELTLFGKKHAAEVFAIFDGHGGKVVAEFLEKNLTDALRTFLEDAHTKRGVNKYDVHRALKGLFPYLTERFFEESRRQTIAGSTAVVALLLEGELYVANVGDSRAFLVTKEKKIALLSKDARPCEPEDRRSIEKRGGDVGRQVIYYYNPLDPLTGTSLSVARAVGDLGAPIPHVARITQRPIEEGVLVLVCDGMLEANIQMKHLSDLIDFENLPKSAEQAVRFAYQHRSRDNLSILVKKLI